MKKLMNLFNVKKWIETFVFKTLVNKGSKHAATVVVGLLGSAFFTDNIQPVFAQLGVSIDRAQLGQGLVVFFGGLAGWVANWALKTMDKDGDGKMG